MMANAKVGSHAGWNGNYVETITTTDDAEQVMYREHAISEAGTMAQSKDGFTIEGASSIGDYWEIFSDGTTWFVNAFVMDADHSGTIDTD
jgi:hypothetical protein